MKHVHPCLTARNDRESSFHHCGGPVKLVQTCFKYQERTRKLFSPLWRYCDACARLFMYVKGLTKRF